MWPKVFAQSASRSDRNLAFTVSMTRLFGDRWDETKQKSNQKKIHWWQKCKSDCGACMEKIYKPLVKFVHLLESVNKAKQIIALDIRYAIEWQRQKESFSSKQTQSPQWIRHKRDYHLRFVYSIFAFYTRTARIESQNDINIVNWWHQICMCAASLDTAIYLRIDT